MRRLIRKLGNDSRSSKELTHEYSEGPKVDGSVMTLVQDDLWRNVLRGAAKSPGFVALVEVFRETKIDLANKREGEMWKVTFFELHTGP